MSCIPVWPQTLYKARDDFEHPTSFLHNLSMEIAGVRLVYVLDIELRLSVG